VLHVLEAFAGGTERHLVDIVRHVAGFEHVVAVPSRHHGKNTALAAASISSAGGKVEPVEMTRSRAPHRNAAALMALRRLVTRLRPDIVHAHSSIGGALARLATLSTEIPVVYTPHALSRSQWALTVERALRWRTDRLIAVSGSEGEFAIAQRVTSRDRLTVIPNGIDLEPAPKLDPSLRTLLELGDDVPLVGCVGRLTWQKAPEVFVSACAIVSGREPRAHFVLIGSGPVRTAFDRAVADDRLSGRFHHLTSLRNAAAALAELDVYVLTSRFEGAPYTPLEAMRAGTPVIVTDAAGSRDVIEHGVSGLVVERDNADAAADAIVTLLQDAGMRESLTRAAHEALVASFDVRLMARSTAAVYEELLASSSSVSAPISGGTIRSAERRPNQ
jgi:glycosyltransferase involved in cell wall biosynthesis